MGRSFSTLLSNLNPVPSPQFLKRNWVTIFLSLAVPKFVWDFYRLYLSKKIKDESDKLDEEEEQKKKKDDPVFILAISILKAVKELRKLHTHCLLTNVEELTLQHDTFIKMFMDRAINEARKELKDKIDVNKLNGFNTELKTGDEVEDKDGNLKNAELLQELNLNAQLSDATTTTDDVEGEDYESNDDFLRQWEETVKNTILGPLQEACASKVLNSKREKNIRNIAYGTLMFIRMIKQMILIERRKILFLHFTIAKGKYENLEAKLKVDAKAGKSNTLPDGKGPEYFLDEMNRARQKLEELIDLDDLESDSKIVDPYYEDLEKTMSLDEAYMQVTPDELLKAVELKMELKQRSLGWIKFISGSVLNEIAVKKDKYHEKLWSQFNFERIDMEEFYSEWKTSLNKSKIHEIIVSHLANAHIIKLSGEYVLGDMRKRRVKKLILFVTNDLCGEWYQRGLIGFSWIVAMVAQVVMEAKMFYQSNLFFRAIENSIGTVSGGLTNGVGGTLGDVLFGMVLLSFSGVFLNDILQKITNAGHGSIRKSLSKKLTHHVLSQDLEDCERKKYRIGNGLRRGRKRRREQNPADILNNVRDHRSYMQTIGNLVSIPMDVFSQSSKLLTTSIIIWNQSRIYAAVVISSILIERTFDRIINRMQRYCAKWSGFDKIKFKGWNKNYSIMEALWNFEDMRVNAKEIEIENSIERVQEQSEIEEICMRFWQNFFMPIRRLNRILPQIISAYFGGVMAQRNLITIVGLTSFKMYATSLLQDYDKLRRTVRSLYNMSDRRFKYGYSVMDILAKKPKIGIDGGFEPSQVEKSKVDKNVREHAKLLLHSENGKNGKCFSLLPGDIEFKNVSFKYKGMQKDMLKNTSFKIKSGSFVGICGERGAGKSTMFKLIMRLYEARKGEVLIGGKPVGFYNPVWLRSQIGMSKQNPVIFRGKTLRQNILYGAKSIVEELGPLEADKFVEKVLKKANIYHHFKNREKFPQGLSTCCYNLSGGEMRSVGTARSLIGSPRILLLDEPTEGLDAVNERKVIKYIVENRPEGQTVLAIAHRLSTIKDADYIIFMDKNGIIAEKGTWNELMNIADGKFKRFRDAQYLKGGDPEGSDSVTGNDGDADDTSSHTDNNINSYALPSTTTTSITSGDEEDELAHVEPVGRNIHRNRDPIRETLNAITHLNNLDSSSPVVPSDLILPLVNICDQILKHYQTLEKHATAARCWKPYGGGGTMFSSPQDLMLSKLFLSPGVESGFLFDKPVLRRNRSLPVRQRKPGSHSQKMRINNRATSVPHGGDSSKRGSLVLKRLNSVY